MIKYLLTQQYNTKIKITDLIN